MTRQQIPDQALASMVDTAQDRHIRIENERIRKLEQTMLEEMHAEIDALLREQTKR